MKEPEFTQHPTEIFGYAFTNLTLEAQAARNNQYCPFLNGKCKKPRQSEPEVKVGVCTVGYKGNFLERMTPISYKKKLSIVRLRNYILAFCQRTIR